jgi:hypothetical protein
MYIDSLIDSRMSYKMSRFCSCLTSQFSAISFNLNIQMAVTFVFIFAVYPIYNVCFLTGIVRFDISRKVDMNGISYSTPFEPVPDCLFRLERMVYTDEEIVDGKRLTYVIRGVDVFGKFAEDDVSAMIDVSPPLIQNISVRFTVSDQSAPKENELM